MEIHRWMKMGCVEAGRTAHCCVWAVVAELGRVCILLPRSNACNTSSAAALVWEWSMLIHVASIPHHVAESSNPSFQCLRLNANSSSMAFGSHCGLSAHQTRDRSLDPTILRPRSAISTTKPKGVESVKIELT
ncbi:unnamed protein product [Calypogeia fissa]